MAGRHPHVSKRETLLVIVGAVRAPAATLLLDGLSDLVESVARILLTDPDPAIASLLAEWGHEPVILDRGRETADQILAADVVLPNPDSQTGREIARVTRRAHGPARA